MLPKLLYVSESLAAKRGSSLKAWRENAARFISQGYIYITKLEMHISNLFRVAFCRIPYYLIIIACV